MINLNKNYSKVRLFYFLNKFIIIIIFGCFDIQASKCFKNFNLKLKTGFLLRPKPTFMEQKWLAWCSVPIKITQFQMINFYARRHYRSSLKFGVARSSLLLFIYLFISLFLEPCDEPNFSSQIGFRNKAILRIGIAFVRNHYLDRLKIYVQGTLPLTGISSLCSKISVQCLNCPKRRGNWTISGPICRL